ncbi:hypothetical protein AVL62_06470 [Serinicoccus chungangensis]|uniref:Uncharacterized protein n=1 Tax=Serinicoccus chungangensis TaxID=767452 RepID=A0A0W8IHA5_9MICO|nr:hypothetical protein [Serinicoccus chungangensis]KUG59319.1 hypothetical protein AVL62_06470 [Serinicoccus chungangensis]
MLIADIMALVAPPVTDLLRRSRSVTQDPQPMFPTIVAVRNDRVLATVSTLRVEATMSAATTMAVGLDPQALVVATEARLDDRPALTYAVMTRERRARWVVQEIHEDGPEVRFSVPVDGGEPRGQAAGTLRVLAEALGQRPVDVSTVARQDRSGTFGEDTFLPPEQGRVVVDAGTMSTLHERVAEIGGQVLYLARSPEAGRLALEAGLPRACLLAPAPPAAS